MAQDSARVVITAIIANAAVAAVKMIVAGATGSAAMFAEGVHSIVDTIDELMLYIGLRRSVLPPDTHHPYGYGKELYFWSMVVSMVVFGIGGGLTIVEGVMRLIQGSQPHRSMWSYVVLGIAAIFEGTSWFVSWRTLRRRSGEEPLWRAIRASKDPSVFTVFVEDSAALVGLVIAFFGILLSTVLGIPALDAAASVLIGILLAVAAILLMRESKDLLVGESAASERIRDLRDVAESEPDVVAVKRPLTMQLGPEAVLVNLEVTFSPTLTGDELLAAIDRLDRRIRSRFPLVKHLFIEAQLLRR